jgi:hypothetical protein
MFTRTLHTVFPNLSATIPRIDLCDECVALKLDILTAKRLGDTEWADELSKEQTAHWDDGAGRRAMWKTEKENGVSEGVWVLEEDQARVRRLPSYGWRTPNVDYWTSVLGVAQFNFLTYTAVDKSTPEVGGRFINKRVSSLYSHHNVYNIFLQLVCSFIVGHTLWTHSASCLMCTFIILHGEQHHMQSTNSLC